MPKEREVMFCLSPAALFGTVLRPVEHEVEVGRAVRVLRRQLTASPDQPCSAYRASLQIRLLLEEQDASLETQIESPAGGEHKQHWFRSCRSGADLLTS